MKFRRNKGVDIPVPPIEHQQKPEVNIGEYLEAHRELIQRLEKLKIDFRYEAIPLRNHINRVEQVLKNGGLADEQVEENSSEAIRELLEIKEEVEDE